MLSEPEKIRRAQLVGLKSFKRLKLSEQIERLKEIGVIDHNGVVVGADYGKPIGWWCPACNEQKSGVYPRGCFGDQPCLTCVPVFPEIPRVARPRARAYTSSTMISNHASGRVWFIKGKRYAYQEDDGWIIGTAPVGFAGMCGIDVAIDVAITWVEEGELL